MMGWGGCDDVGRRGEGWREVTLGAWGCASDGSLRWKARWRGEEGGDEYRGEGRIQIHGATRTR